jgi:hypothetical protein
MAAVGGKLPVVVCVRRSNTVATATEGVSRLSSKGLQLPEETRRVVDK